MGWIFKNHQKKYDLTPEFVNVNYSTGLRRQNKQLCRGGKIKWVLIPPEEDKAHKNLPAHLQTGPSINYHQKEGEKTCLV